MDLIQSIANLINEDPNFAAQSQLAIDTNAQKNDTSLVNKTLADNQKESEQQAKKLANKKKRVDAEVTRQFRNLAKATGDQAKNASDESDAIKRIAQTLGQASKI